MARPCKLQINTAGAWRDVLRFDIDAVDSVALMDAASNLLIIADPSGGATLRIATSDAYQVALVRWHVTKGWVDA